MVLIDTDAMSVTCCISCLGDTKKLLGEGIGDMEGGITQSRDVAMRGSVNLSLSERGFTPFLQLLIGGHSVFRYRNWGWGGVG